MQICSKLEIILTFSRKCLFYRIFTLPNFTLQAHILRLKYKLLAAKGSVSDCNMTRARSIFASLALQLFLSRQVHTSLPQLLRPSWPRDRGKHLLSCFWTLKQIFSSIRRSRSHSSSFWVKDKFTQHRNTSVIPTQLAEGQRQTLAWPFSKPRCLLRGSHQSWGKRCMISLFFVIFSANYVWRGIATKISIFSSIFLWVGFQVPHMGRPVPSCPGVQNLEDGEIYSILMILFVQSYHYLTWGVALTG